MKYITNKNLDDILPAFVSISESARAEYSEGKDVVIVYPPVVLHPHCLTWREAWMKRVEFVRKFARRPACNTTALITEIQKKENI